MSIARLDGAAPVLLGSAVVLFNPVEQDVLLQFDAFGNELSLGAWPVDDYFLVDQDFLGQGAPLAVDVPVANTIMTTAVASPVPIEPEEKEVGKRAVRPLFSDEFVVATRAARRTSAARRR